MYKKNLWLKIGSIGSVLVSGVLVNIGYADNPSNLSELSKISSKTTPAVAPVNNPIPANPVKSVDVHDNKKIQYSCIKLPQDLLTKMQQYDQVDKAHDNNFVELLKMHENFVSKVKEFNCPVEQPADHETANKDVHKQDSQNNNLKKSTNQDIKTTNDVLKGLQGAGAGDTGAGIAQHK